MKYIMQKSLQIIFPESQKQQYNPYEKVDFSGAIPEGMQLKPGSIRFQGDLYMAIPDANEVTTLSKFAGVSTIFDNIICSSPAIGNLPAISNYRYITATYDRLNKSTTSVDCYSDDDELKFTSSQTLFKTAGGVFLSPFSVQSALGFLSFSHNPKIPFNEIVRGALTQKNTGGRFSIQFYLPSWNEMVNSSTIVAGVRQVYYVKNLKMVYLLEPQTVQDSDLKMLMYQCEYMDMKQASTFTRNKNVVEMQLLSLSMFSKKTADVNSPAVPKDQIDDCNIKKFSVSFNDIDNTYIEYPFERREELIYNGILSMNDNNMTEFYAYPKDKNQKQNLVFGLRFPKLLDSATNSITYTLERESPIPNTDFTLFVIYRGVI